MTTIITATAPADFLALVPRLAGYHPSNSIVLIPFERSRTRGVLRVDLPTDAAPEAIDRAAATLIGMVCRLPEVDGVTPVVYTDESFAADDGIAQETLVRALLRRADACGLRVPDALCVASDGWGSYQDASCPPEGRPLSDLESAPAVADIPAALRDVHGDQTTGSDLPTVSEQQQAHVADALDELTHALAALAGTGEDGGPPAGLADAHPQAVAAACAFDDIPALFEDTLMWPSTGPDAWDAASLVWCLRRPALRDVALSQWAGDLARGDAAFDAQLRWSRDGVAYPEDLARTVMGEGPAPDADRLTRALAACRWAAALAPEADRPGPLSAAAWLAWALGRSTHAAAYVDAAQAIEPDHGMAEIVGTLVDAGHLPEWAYTARRDGSAA